MDRILGRGVITIKKWGLFENRHNSEGYIRSHAPPFFTHLLTTKRLAPTICKQIQGGDMKRRFGVSGGLWWSEIRRERTAFWPHGAKAPPQTENPRNERLAMARRKWEEKLGLGLLGSEHYSTVDLLNTSARFVRSDWFRIRKCVLVFSTNTNPKHDLMKS